MMRICSAIALVTLSVALIGCGAAGEESASIEPAMEFKGKPEPKFVGTWKAKDRDSTYQLKEDGKYQHTGTVTRQGNTYPNNFEGDWAATDDRIYFKDPAGNPVPYAWKLEGNTLTISRTGTIKSDIVLEKK